MKRLICILFLSMAFNSFADVYTPTFYCTPADATPGLFDAGVIALTVNHQRATIKFQTYAGPVQKSFKIIETKIINGFAGPIYIYTLSNGIIVSINKVVGTNPIISAKLVKEEGNSVSIYAKFPHCDELR